MIVTDQQGIYNSSARYLVHQHFDKPSEWSEMSEMSVGVPRAKCTVGRLHERYWFPIQYSSEFHSGLPVHSILAAATLGTRRSIKAKLVTYYNDIVL